MGIISLQSLYEFVLNHQNGDALDGQGPAGLEFGQLAAHVAEAIPAKAGFYLWGRYDKRHTWHNVYVGRAANLQSRIREELTNERCCFWRTVLCEEQLLQLGRRYYFWNWYQYEAGWRSSFRKAGTTHIVWVSYEQGQFDDPAINDVEADLIETLNPTANVNRMAPPAAAQEYTLEVVRQMRRAIHGQRANAYGPPPMPT